MKQKVNPNLFDVVNITDSNVTIVQFTNRTVFISLFEPDEKDAFKKTLEKNNATIISYFDNIATYTADISTTSLESILNLDFVLFVENLTPAIVALDESTPQIAADYLRNSYNGFGVSVGIIDTGYEDEHLDLPPFTNCIDYSTDGDCGEDNHQYGHGTFVSGILLGRGIADSKYRGVATGVNDISIAKVMRNGGEINGTDFENSFLWMGNLNPRPKIVSTSVLRPILSCVGSDVVSRLADSLVYDNNQNVVAAAGNCGPSGNILQCFPAIIGQSENILSPACAKNVIAVGAIKDYGNGTIDDVEGFSSRGPSADQRLKPDVVAPGKAMRSVDFQNISGYRSSCSGGEPCGGTSYAAPHISGSIATLLQHYPTYTPDLVHATLLTGTLFHNGDPSTIGNTYGMGKVDSYLSHYQVSTSNGWDRGVAIGSFTSDISCGTFDITVPEDADRLVVALVWHEPAASPGQVNAVYNNLDLFVDKGANNAGCGGDWSSESTVDNKEYVNIAPPFTSGGDTYRIKIWVAQGGLIISPQKYAVSFLIIRGNPAPSTQITETINRPFPPKVYVGEEFTVTAELRPDSFITSAPYVRINRPQDINIVSMETTREDGITMTYIPAQPEAINLGDIIYWDTRSIIWRVKATETGNKTIGLYMDSDNSGIANTSITVEVLTVPPEVCNNGIDDDIDSYADCADADCPQGTPSQSGFCCGSGCSVNGGSCQDASVSGFTCTDGSCNTYSEDCRNGELESDLLCSGTSLSCSGGYCERDFGAPDSCNGLTPGDQVCEAGGTYNERACEVSGTDCYLEGELFCTAPSGCDEKLQDACSSTTGFQCEWQGSGDNVVEECEATSCGAANQCDEQIPGYEFAGCSAAGQTYFADRCSLTCLGEEREDNICRSSAFGADCTADAACNGVIAGTNGCSLDCKTNRAPTQPNITYPNGGEIIDKNVTIRWTESIDPDGLQTLYDLDYSNNSGSNWYSIISKHGLINKTNQSLTTQDLNFTGNQNITIFIDIPKNVTIKNATLDLSGSPDRNEYSSDNNTISLWHFDEGSGNIVYDEKGTNNGTITNAVFTSDKPPIAGNSYSLNFMQNSYVDIGDRPSLDFGEQDNFTIDFWLRASQNQLENPRIIAKRPSGVDGLYEIVLVTSSPYNGKIIFQLAGASGDFPGISTQTQFLDNQWHHVAAVRDRGQNKIMLYVDGIKENETVDTSSGSLSSPAPFTIGSNAGHYEYFNGLIDEVRVSNISRTNFFDILNYTLNPYLEIGDPDDLHEWDYTSKEYFQDSNTLALYHANTGYGTTLIDELGFYNGTFRDVGEPQWTTDAKLGNYAVLFDGVNDYVEQDTLLDSFPDNGTIEFWFKPSGTFNNTNKTIRVFINKLSSSQPNVDSIGIATSSNNGTINCRLDVDGISKIIYTITSSWIQGTWYHIACTWGSSGMKIYVNGVEEASDSSNISPRDGTYSGFFIGTNYLRGEPFSGSMDEMRISKIQRTSFNFNLKFNTTEITPDFSQKLNSVILSCNCSNCILEENTCTVPFMFHSDTNGTLEISNINIRFNATSYDWNATLLPEDSNYKVRVRSTDGILNSSYDESNNDFTIRHSLDLSNLTVLYNSSRLRIFEFIISNKGGNNLSNISWSFNTGQITVNSTMNTTLDVNKNIRIGFEHNYSIAGNYTIIASSRANEFSDSESISIEVT